MKRLLLTSLLWAATLACSSPPAPPPRPTPAAPKPAARPRADAKTKHPCELGDLIGCARALVVVGHDQYDAGAFAVAYAHARLGDEQGARAILEQSVKKPRRSELMERVGQTLIDEGDVELGLRWLEIASDDVGHSNDIRERNARHVIVAYYRAGKPERAKALLDELGPRARGLDALSIARGLIAIGRVEDARPYVRRAAQEVDMDPDHPSAVARGLLADVRREALGEAFVAVGMREAALALLDDSTPSLWRVDVMLALAERDAREGRSDDAKKELGRAQRWVAQGGGPRVSLLWTTTTHSRIAKLASRLHGPDKAAAYVKTLDERERAVALAALGCEAQRASDHPAATRWSHEAQEAIDKLPIRSRASTLAAMAETSAEDGCPEQAKRQLDLGVQAAGELDARDRSERERVLAKLGEGYQKLELDGEARRLFILAGRPHLARGDPLEAGRYADVLRELGERTSLPVIAKALAELALELRRQKKELDPPQRALLARVTEQPRMLALAHRALKDLYPNDYVSADAELGDSDGDPRAELLLKYQRPPIAVEYVGDADTHADPLWGGADGLAKRRKRLERLREICTQRGIRLIELDASWDRSAPSLRRLIVATPQ
jgi:hypothetical protein